MSNTPIYLHLATLTAPKTSLNAQGGIVYAVLKDGLFLEATLRKGEFGCVRIFPFLVGHRHY